MKEPKYFELSEFLKSETAQVLNINNFPSWEDVERMKRFAVETLDPIRSHWGQALLISSGYRVPELNIAVGGSPTSDHMNGLAVDIKLPHSSRKKLVELYTLIVYLTEQGTINIDQIIFYRRKGIIHIGVGERLRKQFIVKP